MEREQRDGGTLKNCLLARVGAAVGLPRSPQQQSGINWAQMGLRGVALMGTRCPLHLISSLSHGVLSPGRQSRAGIGWKREALADLDLRFSLRKYVVPRSVT